MGQLWVPHGPLSLASFPLGWAETEILGSKLTLLEDLPPFGGMHPMVPPHYARTMQSVLRSPNQQGPPIPVFLWL